MSERRPRGENKVRIHMGIDQATPIFNVAFNSIDTDGLFKLIDTIDYDNLLNRRDFRAVIQNGIVTLEKITKDKSKRLLLEEEKLKRLEQIIERLKDSLFTIEPLN